MINKRNKPEKNYIRYIQNMNYIHKQDNCENAQITVYLSLMFILILSLICTAIEGVRVEGAKTVIQNTMYMGVESVFAEYNKILLEDYDLFFLDTSYGTSSDMAVETRMYEYMRENYNLSNSIAGINSASFYKINCENLNIDKKVLATDDMGGPYFAQAVDYMKSKINVNQLLALFTDYKNTTNESINQYKNAKNESSSDLSGLNEEKENYRQKYDAAVLEAETNKTEVTMTPPSTESNPLDAIGGYESSPILELILGNEFIISGKQVDKTDFLSGRNLKNGSGNYKKETTKLADIIFVEYMQEKFPNAVKGNDENNLSHENAVDYQLEYIYAGKDSDYQNLENVLTKILLMREGINFSYLITDTEKNAQAQALAMALVGYLGIPIFVQGMKLAIIAGWAFTESVVELRALMRGEKVALIKDASNWNLDIANIANINNVEFKKPDKGMDYMQCMKLLFYMGDMDKYIIRSMDMIEMQVRDKSGNNTFCLDNCMMKCNVETSWHIDNVFLKLPYKFLESNDGYDTESKIEYTYIKEN